MAWTEITRRHYRREGLRYGSDTTDADWFVMEPLLPPASALGHPRATWPMSFFQLTANDHLAASINPMNLENRLGDV